MKKIFWIEFWLWTFPPWGLWLLYKEAGLTRLGKFRLLTYSFLIPMALLMAVSIYSIHHTKLMLESMNVDG